MNSRVYNSKIFSFYLLIGLMRYDADLDQSTAEDYTSIVFEDELSQPKVY